MTWTQPTEPSPAASQDMHLTRHRARTRTQASVSHVASQPPGQTQAAPYNPTMNTAMLLLSLAFGYKNRKPKLHKEARSAWDPVLAPRLGDNGYRGTRLLGQQKKCDFLHIRHFGCSIYTMVKYKDACSQEKCAWG